MELAAIAERGGRAEGLDGPPLPALLGYLWRWWGELDDARPEGLSGPGVITYTEIHAWAALTGRVLQPFEVRLLKAADRVYRRVFASKPAEVPRG